MIFEAFETIGEFDLDVEFPPYPKYQEDGVFGGELKERIRSIVYKPRRIGK